MVSFFLKKIFLISLKLHFSAMTSLKFRSQFRGIQIAIQRDSDEFRGIQITIQRDSDEFRGIQMNSDEFRSEFRYWMTSAFAIEIGKKVQF